MAQLLSLHCTGDARIDNRVDFTVDQIYVNGTRMLSTNAMFPVGAVYITTNSSMPDGFVGTWSQSSSTATIAGVTVYVFKRTA